MLEKRNFRKAPPPMGKKAAPAQIEDRMFHLATRMLTAEGKNPYHKGDLTIRNIDELDQNIASFEHHEAPWVADWLEYLGDAETAGRIRGEPVHFKRLIHERVSELRKIYK